MKKVPEVIIEISRQLRKNMTKSEILLWDRLKTKKLSGVKFVRQMPIYLFTENTGLDRFIIPDFLCRNLKIVIELDGSIHSLKEVYLLDKEKELLLSNLGYKVLRFNNDEIINDIDTCIEKIVSSFSG